VLDLARLLALAQAAGVAGVVPELGFFFKDPWGSGRHGAADQASALVAWARGTSAVAPAARRTGAGRTGTA
jgi:myo-inositol-1-phosphate synthase